MARIMPELEFRSFHSHRSCEIMPNTTRLATLARREGAGADQRLPPMKSRSQYDCEFIVSHRTRSLSNAALSTLPSHQVSTPLLHATRPTPHTCLHLPTADSQHATEH